MKKHILLSILMFFLMASVQFSACSNDDDDDSSNCDVDIATNTPTNDYEVVAQVWGGLQGCGIVQIQKDGEEVTDAIVKINGYELPYDESMGYVASLAASDGSEMELEVTHNGSVISSGKTCIPSNPTITNIDSGDVHQLSSSLTVQWKSVDYATAIELSIDENVNYQDYNSGLLDPTTTSHTIPATFFDLSSQWVDSAECMITVSAYYGIDPSMESTVLDSSSGVGVNIEGSSGAFIGLNMDETTIYVPLGD